MHVFTPAGRSGRIVALVALVAATLASLPGGAGAASPGQTVVDYWTAERMEAAIPRDLVVDERGQGHLRRPDGTLQPYGGSGTTPAAKPTNPGGGNGGGGGTSDSEGPAVTNFDPAVGDQVTSTPHMFSATVTDPSGVKSVTFHVTGPDGTTSSHVASLGSSDTWTASVTVSNGDWSWTVEARDGAKKGGNTITTDPVAFSVALPSDDPGGDPEPDENVVTNAPWTGGGTVQTAAGRIYFEMPGTGPFWNGYVCSGTVATDEAGTRSIIITAAHCVYDEVNDVFARNVMFIPNQDETSGSGTDTDCTNDPLGCWAPTHGVVHQDWANGSWPDIIPHDYGYYVVPTTDAHAGTTADPSLEVAAGSLAVQFTTATQGAFTHALGYSYSEDPKFMYCAEDLGLDAGSYNSLWLDQCGLSGGASGGPWMQPVEGGNGPIIGVNSYGYSNRDGMGAAHLTGTAGCMLTEAETAPTPSSTVRGIVSSCR